MRLEYVVFTLVGLLLGLAGYVAAFALWALNMYLANHPI